MLPFPMTWSAPPFHAKTMSSTWIFTRMYGKWQSKMQTSMPPSYFQDHNLVWLLGVDSEYLLFIPTCWNLLTSNWNHVAENVRVYMACLFQQFLHLKEKDRHSCALGTGGKSDMMEIVFHDARSRGLLLRIKELVSDTAVDMRTWIWKPFVFSHRRVYRRISEAYFSGLGHILRSRTLDGLESFQEHAF
jgi:hypothetical protein